ncbi:MAG: hypothetical protein RSB25_10075, partial [Acinetobacter sp.]
MYLSYSLCFCYPFRDFCLKLKPRGKRASVDGVFRPSYNPVLIVDLAFESCRRAMHFGVEFCATTRQRDG